MLVMSGAVVFGGLILGTVGAAADAPPVEVGSDGERRPPTAASAWVRAGSASAGAISAVQSSTATSTTLAPTTTSTTAPPPAPTTTTTTAPPRRTTAPTASAPSPATAPTSEPAPAPEPAPEPASAPPPAPTTSAEEAIAAWFPDVYEEAVAVARCESSMNPGAVSSGGGNHGLFQINDVHRDQFTAVTGQPWDAVYDAYYNSHYARHLYNQSGWQAWACRP
jgi:hypothetical protein